MKLKPLPVRSFGPGGSYTKNVWEVEGWVGSVKTITTKTGYLMAAMDVVDREPADLARRRKQGPPIWVRTVAFNEISERLVNDFAEGSRVFLRGNFHNRPRGSRFGFLTKWVVNEVRAVEGDATRVINQWTFEGVIARDPCERESKSTKKKLISVGIWQPTPRAANGRFMSAPVIINPVALPGSAARQILEFKKGDPVFVSGHFLCFTPKGATQLVIDRIYPMDPDWMDKRTGKKVAAVLTPGLDEGVLEL